MAILADATTPAKIEKTSFFLGVTASNAERKWPVSSVTAKNRWLNAHGEVWQRYLVKSLANPATNIFGADRMRILYDVDSGTPPTTLTHWFHEATASEDGAYAITTTGAGSSYGANSFYKIVQRILHGTQTMTGGNYVTMAFEAWTSTGTSKKIGVGLKQNYGTGGSPTAEETIAGGYVTLGTSPSWHSVTFQTNTLSGKTLGTDENSYLQPEIWYQWGAGEASKVGDTVAEDWGVPADIHITDMMFYKGDSTGMIKPYVNRSETEELIMLLPYCEAIFPSADGETSISAGFAETTTAARGVLTYSPKVFIPGVTGTLPMQFLSRGGATYSASAVAFSKLTKSRCQVDLTISGALAGRAGILEVQTGGKIIIDAEI